MHLCLTEDTTQIVKEGDLSNMKEHSVLINTARAELIEKEALRNILKSGKNIFVGVDVYEEEPIYDKNYELLYYNNVICTPYIGYVQQNGKDMNYILEKFLKRSLII